MLSFVANKKIHEEQHPIIAQHPTIGLFVHTNYGFTMSSSNGTENQLDLNQFE